MYNALLGNLLTDWNADLPCAKFHCRLQKLVPNHASDVVCDSIQIIIGNMF